ncbi:MAG: HEAT repeat domain-containing protein [Gemmataceae bacterium]
MVASGRNSRIALAMTVAILLSASVATVSRGDDAYDSVMYRDPAITVSKTESTFDPGLLDLWLVALERPDVEMRTRAAMSIARAQTLGMPGLSKAVDPLRKAFDRADQHLNVRLACAKALVALDAKSAADSLLKFAEANSDAREMIFPALARWDYAPARAVWLAILDRPAPFQREHVLAAESLGTVKDANAVPKLRERLFANEMTAPIRLEFARVLSRLQTSGLEPDAAKCTFDTLAAVTLLQNHSGPEAVRRLQEYARNRETSVAAVAAKRLLAIDPNLVLPVLDVLLANDDEAARGLAVETMLRLPGKNQVGKLTVCLSDVHPLVRNQARLALVKYAESGELKPAVMESLVAPLNGTDWRGQEQAALLAAQIGNTKVTKRLVELLASPRPETFKASAWALQKLAVRETLPAVLEHVMMRQKQLPVTMSTPGLENATGDDVDVQLSYLIQFLGQARYKPADETLRLFVPRFSGNRDMPRFSSMKPEARAAAIWALGYLYENQTDADLAAKILERLTGDPGMGRDDERVRRMAAVAMVRMKNSDALTGLKENAEGDKPTVDIVAHTCRWSIAQLEKKPLPVPSVVKIPQVNWFLVPNR